MSSAALQAACLEREKMCVLTSLRTSEEASFSQSASIAFFSEKPKSLSHRLLYSSGISIASIVDFSCQFAWAPGIISPTIHAQELLGHKGRRIYRTGIRCGISPLSRGRLPGIVRSPSSQLVFTLTRSARSQANTREELRRTGADYPRRETLAGQRKCVGCDPRYWYWRRARRWQQTFGDPDAIEGGHVSRQRARLPGETRMSTNRGRGARGRAGDRASCLEPTTTHTCCWGLV